MPTAEAGGLLRYRRAIGAEHIAVFTDVWKKHAAHAITADLSLEEIVHGAEFFGADGVVLTGRFTGDQTSVEDLASARAATRLPVIVGSGTTAGNISSMLRHADAVIVGSSIKRAGRWSNPIDAARARAIVKAARSRAR